MGINLNYNNWRIAVSDVQLQQYDNNSQKLKITGTFPAGYTFTAEFRIQGVNYNSVALTSTSEGLEATLTAAMLAAGNTKYTLQIKGVQGTTIRYTNKVEIYVPDSISGDAVFPTVPSAFTQAVASAQAAQAAAETAAAQAAGVTINGTYNATSGTVTLEFPSGTTDYYAYISGLLTAGKTVRLKIKQYLTEEWAAMFYYAKSSTPRHEDAFHCFVDREVKDDYTPFGGFIVITSDSVTFVADSSGGGGGAANAVLYTEQTLTSEQKTQARTNIGAGTSSFDGAYGSLTGKPTIPTKTSDLQNDSGYLTAHQSLADYSTTAQMNAAISAHHDSTKQDTIADLAAIRSGAALGATALQSHQSLAAYRTASAQDAIDATKAERFEVTFTSVGSALYANKTVQEIYAAHLAGKIVVGNLSRNSWDYCYQLAEAHSILPATSATLYFYCGYDGSIIYGDRSITASSDSWELRNSDFQPKAITDTGGYYTTDTVEGALQEIGAELSGINTLIGSGVIE